MKPLLILRQLTKTFPSRRRRGARLVAVNGVDLEIGRGESVALIGESGSGKSTLARCIAGIEEPESGSIHFDATDISRLQGAEKRRFRRRSQMLFQDSAEALNPRQTVRSVLDEALIAGTEERRSRDDLKKARHALFEEVGLRVEHETRFPHQLSGGERQRLALCRALAPNPDLLILDEPVSALDASLRAQVLAILESRRHNQGTSQLMISHDLAAARRAGRVAVMYLGEIVEIGPAERILTRPAHPYSAGLMKSRPTLGKGPTGGRKRGRFEVMPGEIPSPESPPTGCVFHPRCAHLSEKCRRSRPTPDLLGPDHSVSCFHQIADLPPLSIDLDPDDR